MLLLVVEMQPSEHITDEGSHPVDNAMEETLFAEWCKSKRLLFFIIVLIVHCCVGGFSTLFNDFEIVPGIRFWGGDLEINYLGISFIPPLTTRLCIAVGFGYETAGYFRNPDNTLYCPPQSASIINHALFTRLEGVWSLGLRQGILFDRRKEDNLLEAHFIYRGKYSDYLEEVSSEDALIFSSGLIDSSGILQNSLVVGLFLNSVVEHDSHRKRNGIQADVSGEVAPEYLGNNIFGLADFSRFTVDIRGFVTVLDLDPENIIAYNTFNIYLGDRILLDYLCGGYIPLNARQSVGGREANSSDGLGGVMRGVEKGRFDGYIKILNNFDIRMNLPTLWFFVPSIVFYFDTGVSDNLDYTISVENILFSTGAGFSFYGFGFDLIIYINYFINEGKISPSFDFSLCF
jgi:hypothetical protein